MMPQTAFGQAALAGVLFCVVLAVAGGLLTQLSPWYYNLRQPVWKPPDWAFGPVWTVVFLCLTLAIAYAWDAADASQRVAMLWVLAINGALNIAWSGIFFILKSPAWAFVELIVFWLSIVAVIYVLGGASRTAAVLLIPYITWVTAAGLLNYQVMKLNPS
jgi:translocator protein